jgi:internalin A
MLVDRKEVPGQFGSSLSADGSRASLDRLWLTSVPEWLGQLADLKELRLIGNRLVALPDWFGSLAGLTVLYLDENWLLGLPDSIGNLTAMSRLSLTGNQLTSLPDSIGALGSLTTLNLAGNQLTSLPDSIGALGSLTTLNLAGNQLTSLPDSIGALGSLTTLNLAGNQLTSLPIQLAHLLIKGLHINLDGNPLEDPLPELLSRGVDALAAYLASLDDAIVQYEAKLLVVGEGNVGKSSLVAALRGAPFVEGRPTTHGIEIWPLAIRHPALGSTMRFDQQITLRAWDFGGQEVYRVTHQFFFSRRALYMVVWNARDGQEQDYVDSWLRGVRLRAGRNTRTMIVATHCSERLPELDYPRLKQEFPDMLAGSFEVDNRTQTGISQLREAIGQEAARLPHMGQRISLRWVAARDAILAHAQKEPQIPYDLFVKVCERHDVTRHDILTLAQLMHDLGYIIYYGEDEGLKDIVVLNPEWLTKAISYVLEDKLTKDAGGVLDHARLKDIWQNRPDGAAYPARYHPYFLRLMEKFDVSYRLEGDELHSLVAQLVPHERPPLPWRPRTRPPAGLRTLALVCRLAEPAPGLIPWLTVRHHRASTGLHWRHGVFLRHPIAAYASEALLELGHASELAVEVRAPSPDLYFNVLRDSIEDLITHRWPGLTYKLFIPCPAKMEGESICPGAFPLEGLLRLRENGHTTYPCIECTGVHEISILLTGFTVPDQPLAVEVKQMREQLTNFEEGLVRAEGLAAETAESVRRIMRVVSVEVTDCPRLFTLARDQPGRARRMKIYQDHYRLTLWCEHSGHWHPWFSASYELDPPKEWIAHISPYARLVFRTLQLVIPLGGSVANVLLPADQLERAQDDLRLMSALVEHLPGKVEEDLGAVALSAATGRLTAAEGEALRAIRAVLFDRDRLRQFGGLRRVQAPSGDFLWVCSDHYLEYDPGLPTVP